MFKIGATTVLQFRLISTQGITSCKPQAQQKRSGQKKYICIKTWECFSLVRILFNAFRKPTSFADPSLRSDRPMMKETAASAYVEPGTQPCCTLWALRNLYGTSAELLRNLCRTSAAPLQNLSGTSMEPMQNLYGFPPETLHNLGSVEAPLRQRVQNLCLRNLCRTSACGTSAEPLRNLYRTSPPPLWNLCRTSGAPLRVSAGKSA